MAACSQRESDDERSTIVECVLSQQGASYQQADGIAWSFKTSFHHTSSVCPIGRTHL